jgi:hypothetical protein
VNKETRMACSRRSVLAGALAGAFAAPLAACVGDERRSGLTRLYVLGTIHSGHRRSRAYSLEVLAEAFRRAEPDILLAEIPPDRIAEAYRSFRYDGRVTEPRTAVFPEYVDVAFPLTRDLGFEIVGTAGWTQEIADNRQAALARIQRDPARARQWAEHLDAQAEFERAVGQRADDPRFIHSAEYDRLVERAQTPYQRYFDADLGAGGWTRINAAHNALINAELDRIGGRGLTAIVTFGSWHKYMILRSLVRRRDVELLDPRALFAA